jgi:hypothetical protein
MPEKRQRVGSLGTLEEETMNRTNRVDFRGTIGYGVHDIVEYMGKSTAIKNTTHDDVSSGTTPYEFTSQCERSIRTVSPPRQIRGSAEGYRS